MTEDIIDQKAEEQEVYYSVLDLLCDRSRWTKGIYAKDCNGLQVHPCDDKAIAWCLSGALTRIYPLGMTNEDMVVIYRWLQENCGHKSIGTFNDSATHNQILKFLSETGI